MITPAQCRAGRALLNLSQAVLADRAGVGLSSVRDLETKSRDVSEKLVEAIQAALESGGVEFIEGGARLTAL